MRLAEWKFSLRPASSVSSPRLPRIAAGSVPAARPRQPQPER